MCIVISNKNRIPKQLADKDKSAIIVSKNVFLEYATTISKAAEIFRFGPTYIQIGIFNESTIKKLCEYKDFFNIIFFKYNTDPTYNIPIDSKYGIITININDTYFKLTEIDYKNANHIINASDGMIKARELFEEKTKGIL